MLGESEKVIRRGGHLASADRDSWHHWQLNRQAELLCYCEALFIMHDSFDLHSMGGEIVYM